ncbi:ATP-dependent helicase [Paratractidigestivibacter sp.]|uniref:ATP-dependent helicase n=1 Tax=Paratractidigestivibacter sp. TaxID=2847316 RepID=UPI002AC95FFF|nr:ATP-dependent helicase [Paratractidigestivibacter sp.]
MMIEPSKEQAAAIACEESAVVSARPGSGKTFTMARMIAKTSERLLSYQGIVAISYTRKASAQLRSGCTGLGVRDGNSFFGTIDAFCLGVIIQQFVSHVVGQKVELEVADDDRLPPVSKIKDRWSKRDEDRWDLVREALGLGVLPVSALSEVAFCMVRHVPAVRDFLRARYVAVYIDEYQDCGLAQHMLFRELVDLGIRGVAFGDMDQAIFAYDGRSPDFLHELIVDPRFKTFEITENRRCHRSIVDYSLMLLDEQTPSCPCQDKRVVLAEVPGDEGDVARAIRGRLDVISERYGVACRNEFALLSTSNRMLKRYAELLSVPSKIVVSTKLDDGFSRSRAFFRELLAFLYSGGYAGDFLDRYIHAEQVPRMRLKANDLLQRLQQVPDDSWGGLYDYFFGLEELCLDGVDGPETHIYLREVLSDVDKLRDGFRPARKDEVNLLTYHKAKGLEFDVVFCLDCYQYIMPKYKYEEADYDAYRQALNVHYVGLTRARKVCYIPLAERRHNANEETRCASPSEFLQMPGLKDLRREVRWDAGGAFIEI